MAGSLSPEFRDGVFRHSLYVDPVGGRGRIDSAAASSTLHFAHFAESENFVRQRRRSMTIGRSVRPFVP
jgi:hypothetical protein